MDPTRDVLLVDVKLDQSPRVRVDDNAEAVKDYADAYRRNEKLPPPLLYLCPGTGYLVADGRHRIMAAREADLERLTCYVRPGSSVDCLAAALSANSRHGLRRTHADKRMCVEKALRQWPQNSDRQIAELVHVGHDLVATVRSLLICRGLVGKHDQRLGMDGKLREVKAIPALPEEPPCSSPRNPVKRDQSLPVTHTVPPPLPNGMKADAVPLILHVRQLLEELWEAHPSWRIAAFRRALTELKVLTDELQMELPGLGENKAAKMKRFVPPTVDEVRQWCKRDGLPLSHAEEFVNFYGSKGWKVGKNPMVSVEGAFARSRKWDSAKINGKEVQRNLEDEARKTIGRIAKGIRI